MSSCACSAASAEARAAGSDVVVHADDRGHFGPATGPAYAEDVSLPVAFLLAAAAGESGNASGGFGGDEGGLICDGAEEEATAFVCQERPKGPLQRHFHHSEVHHLLQLSWTVSDDPIK